MAPPASATAETTGYLAAIQTRDGLVHVQLITSIRHDTFNLAWIRSLPPPLRQTGKTKP
jgi:hypothetical protein